MKNSIIKGAILTALLIGGLAHIYAEECIPTVSDALGPYYVSGMPVLENLNRFGKPGEPLLVKGRILSATSRNGVAARIEVWQTDGEGRYYPEGNGRRTGYLDSQLDMRGTVLSDAAGNFSFNTVVPSNYGSRPPHIHYRISAPGYRLLITQHYIHTRNNNAGGPCRGARLISGNEGRQFPAPDIYLRPIN